MHRINYNTVDPALYDQPFKIMWSSIECGLKMEGYKCTCIYIENIEVASLIAGLKVEESLKMEGF